MHQIILRAESHLTLLALFHKYKSCVVIAVSVDVVKSISGGNFKWPTLVKLQEYLSDQARVICSRR